MNPIDDDTFYAWIDGELAAPAAAAVAAAVAADPLLAARAQQQRELRDRLRAAHAGILDEAVPDRLLAAFGADADVGADGTAIGPLAPGAGRGTARTRHLADGRDAANAPRWTWGAIAASLVIGAFGGRLLLPPSADPAVADAASTLPPGVVAALDSQLASTQRPDAPVRIGLSYWSKDAQFCRSYAVPRSGAAGIACHDAAGWQPRLWTRDPAAATDAVAAADRMRTAATPLPPALLSAVDDQAAAPPLDAAQERAAMDRGWRVDPAATTAPAR